ncbi:MAG: hypothetical protein D6753_01580 [Planctomycetota bacterium]|nr:MAG: hypothetical protein D6753_01580 [Planctomycetota bacterium]
MSFIRRYWIAGLVVVLVIIHAIIIGYVRAEATKVKVAASNEIPLGVYYVQSTDKNWLTQLRVHVVVSPEKRMAAKSTIERHRWTLHEVVEERLRQMDPKFLRDAVLLEIKEQIRVALDEELKDDVIEKIVINDRMDLPVHRFDYGPVYDPTHPEPIFTSQQASDASGDSAAE